MINFKSQAEIEELCEAMLSQYRGRDAPTPQRVDIDVFVQDYLKCTIRYEAFAEDIDEQGRLLIRCGSEKKYLCSGEISIRPISSR